MQRIGAMTASVLLVALALPGCGGGANATTTVRYRPANPEAIAGATEAAVATTGDAATTETGVGSWKGKVVYEGDFRQLPPTYEKGAAPKDPAVCGTEATPDESVVVNGGGLANVFIYLPKAPKGALPPPSPEPVLFDQKFCVFQPHALVVRTGQTMKILNADSVLHNTHTYPVRNTGFNKGVNQNDRSGVELIYTQPEKEPFQVKCDVHPWMLAWHLPIDHPFAAVSGPDGQFEIKDLPAGKHTFRVWHEKGGELVKALSITIKPNETTAIDIPVAAAKLSQFQGPAPRVIQLSSTR